MSFTRAPISAVITDAAGNTINLGNASGAFTAAPVSIVLTDANGNTLNVGPGVVAKYDATAQQANVGPFTLYSVPAARGGMYRLTALIVLTQAATSSSTLPAPYVSYTDNDSGVAISNVQFGGFPTQNTVGLTGNVSSIDGGDCMIAINVRAGTNIQFLTSNYASSGATPMQFAVHVKLEYLGA